MTNQNIPIADSPYLYMNGVMYSYTRPIELTVSTGTCRDSNNLLDIIISEPILININSFGLKGLDTGTLQASHCYAVCVVADSSGNNVPSAMIFDQLNQNQPILPSGYDAWRLVGYCSTNGSNLLINFNLFGNSTDRYLKFVNSQSINGTGTITTTATFKDASALVPNVEWQIVDLYTVYTPDTVTNNASISTFPGFYNYDFYAPVVSTPISNISSLLMSNNTLDETENTIGIMALSTSDSDNFVINVSGFRFDT